MNEEIKEILDKLKDVNWYDELDLTRTMWIELTWKETHLLLDYITNLQKKYENAVEDYELEKYKNIKALSWTNRVIEIIKQQPSEDDTWILENLHSIKYLLKGSDKE